jgi:F420-non-reducing hydrogenase large subunit
MTRLTIDPITRLEGHGRIEILLDDRGDVAEATFQVPELRGFESFCVGRHAEDLPVITSRICGVCPEAHLVAGVKALDDLFEVTPPPAACKVRELFYSAFFITDHATHFFALGGPDLLVGPDAPPAERNLLGVVRLLGAEAGGAVVACRRRNHDVIKRLGGRGINPVAAIPGGWSRPLTQEDRGFLQEAARANVAFAETALQVFHDVVMGNPERRALMTSEAYLHRTYSMGTVDAHNRVNFYDGVVRVVDPEGREVARYAPRDYRDHVEERVVPHSYMKMPYLKQVGWKGLVDGVESGVYAATPLARINVTDEMATPKAQEELLKLRGFYGVTSAGGRPASVHHRMATHWARLVELLYAAERMEELAHDPDITSPEIRVTPTGAVRPGGGVGSVEAPRGTLTHAYRADGQGVVTGVDLVVGTTNNHAAIAMSIKQAAQAFIRAGVVATDGLLNRVEMAFRLYDPCLSCATHALPGEGGLRVVVRDHHGEVRCVVGEEPGRGVGP